VVTAVLKKTYHLAALLALLHLLVASGGLVFLLATGRLNRERAGQIAGVLRGDLPAAQAAQVEEEAPVAPPTKSVESIEHEQRQEEMVRYMSDRRRAELEQQAATGRAALLQVTREREALSRQAEELETQRKQRMQQEESEGFRKDLELFGSMKPKDAVYYMLQKQPEDAARMLLMMDTRKAKKIVEAAKTPAERKTMSQVLQTMREIDPTETESLLKQEGG